MQSSVRRAILVILAALPLFGGTFGKVISLRGNISDLAVDERRGVVYAANYTANRVEVVSMSSHAPVRSYPVGKQPNTLALSANQRFLVVGHNAPFEDPNTPYYALTIIDLDASEQRVISLNDEGPLAVVFGNSNEALIVTTKGFHYLEPFSGSLFPADVLPSATETLPVEPGKFPGNILKASAGVSGNGESAYILTTTDGEDGNWIIQYAPSTKTLSVLGVVTTPPLGPRSVSVDREGGRVLAGWGYLTPNPYYYLLGQIPQSTGNFVAGGHAFDARRDLIYAMAEVGEGGSTNGGSQIVNKVPALHVMDTDNLTVRERIVLPQWLAGKSVFTSDYRTLYAISNSGIIALDLDRIATAPRAVPTVENLLFQGNTCDRGPIVQTFDIVSPNADPADVAVSVPSGAKGIKISQSSSVTPVTVRIEVDPLVYQNQQGTVEVPLTITSRAAVNIPDKVRVLINTKDFDQRGRVLTVGGRIVDVLPDPWRGRFYVLRQDKNAVLVYNANSDAHELLSVMRTGNTPTSMAITEDGRYLLTGNDNSQYVSVFDLDSMQRLDPVIFPLGQYPRSIAAGAGAILATTRSADGPHRVFRINLGARTTEEFDSLGIFTNDIDEDSVLSASPFGGTILLAQSSGAMLVYEGAANTFVAARNDAEEVSGAFAAMSDDLFVVGNNVYDRSLVPSGTLGTGVGTPSGVGQIFGDSYVRTGATATGPGAIQRVAIDTLTGVRSARMTEAPLTETTAVVPPDESLIGWVETVFTRTLAVVPGTNTIVSTSVSGVTILPYDYDAAVAMPSIDSVTNVADGTAALAPGSLIRIQGSNLAASSASSGTPWPTALGEACVQVNGNAVPLTRVSQTELLGQLPYTLGGGGALIVRNAGGVSGAYNLTLFQGAAAIFRDGKAGDQSGLATVVRAKNGQLVTPSNPVHAEDTLQIFVAGLGRVTPDVNAGTPSPDPGPKTLIPAQVILAGEVLPQLAANLVPGQVGVYRIDVLVPWWIKTGNSLPLVVKQGSYETTLNVRVVGN